jgi:hypothetical protein
MQNKQVWNNMKVSCNIIELNGQQKFKSYKAGTYKNTEEDGFFMWRNSLSKKLQSHITILSNDDEMPVYFKIPSYYTIYN